ncbi:hypothetical protein DID78_05645 [Candidatus Marinamargulisbacteria bacterium SCGC AG-343-D04]|nr:hypothetical protein DID78_05645 [Candidatus Marinamargulisbacteria bacterium SCGC AG-343-D04]
MLESILFASEVIDLADVGLRALELLALKGRLEGLLGDFGGVGTCKIVLFIVVLFLFFLCF